jgi:hypothetical protein
MKEVKIKGGAKRVRIIVLLYLISVGLFFFLDKMEFIEIEQNIFKMILAICIILPLALSIYATNFYRCPKCKKILFVEERKENCKKVFKCGPCNILYKSDVKNSYGHTGG